MQAIAFIPARGGSKRVPRKNIYPICGIPMIGWVIQTVISTKLFSDVVVSSDDEEILSIAAGFSANTHKRPANLADDFTHVTPVVDFYINSLSIKPESVCLIYPTAILLRKEHLLDARSELNAKEVGAVLPVAQFPSPIQRAYQCEADGSIQMVCPEHENTRSQDLPKRYRDAGLFFWWKLKNGGLKTVCTHVPKSCAIDIDEPEDLKIATALFKVQQDCTDLF